MTFEFLVTIDFKIGHENQVEKTYDFLGALCSKKVGMKNQHPNIV